MLLKRRIAAAVFCACFLLGLTSYAASREELYFVAVENMVAPLTEETMPFWRDGYLYISSDVFTGAIRDAIGISRAKIGDGVLLYRGEQSLLFRNRYPYAQDSQEETYAPGMVWYEGSAYVPAAVVARYFNLTYSTVNVKRGKLVWLRSASFRMTDEAFAKAAEFQLNAAYQEYLRSLEPEPETSPEEEPSDEMSAFAEAWETAPAPDEGETSVTITQPFAPSVPATTQPDTPSAPTTTQPVTPSAPTTTQPVTPSAPTTAQPDAPSTPATRRPVTPSAPTTTQPVTPSAPTTTQPVTPSAPTTTQPDAPSAPATTQPVTPPDSAMTENPQTTAPVTPPESAPETRGGQQIYLCLRGDDATSSLLDALERHDLRAAVFCDETFLSERGDLLRRMSAAGHRVGLYVTAGPSASVLEQLRTCNEQLRRVTMEKTRLVYADGAGDTLLRAVQGAGFVCLRPALDRTQSPLRTSRQAADLLSAVSQQSDSVTVWLGGTVSRSGLNAFLNDALEVGDAFPALNETVFF